MAKFKKATKDQILEARQDQIKVVGEKQAITKAARGIGKAAPSYDASARSARFIMSTENPDRYRDVVVIAGLDIENFLENPVAPLMHNTRELPVGHWEKLEKSLNGRPKRLEGDFVHGPIDERAPRIAEVAYMLENGLLRACSIGFIPDWDDVDYILNDDESWSGGLRFNKSELIECSPCVVPANPDALIKAAGQSLGLAKELLEELLDNYARDPISKELLTREDFEKKYLIITGNKKSVVIEGKSFAVGDEIAAEETDRQIAERGLATLQKGGSVWKLFKKDAAGAEVFKGFAVKNVDKTEEFEFSEFEGLDELVASRMHELNGVTLNAVAEAVAKVVAPFDGGTVGVEGAVNAKFIADDGKWKHLGALADGDTVDHLVIASPKDDGFEYKAAAENTRAKKLETDTKIDQLSIDVDTKPIEESVKRTVDLLETFKTKVLGIFGVKDVVSEVDRSNEPPMKQQVEPTADEITAARAKAAALLERGNSLVH